MSLVLIRYVDLGFLYPYHPLCDSGLKSESSKSVNLLEKNIGPMCGRSNIKKYDLWISLNQPTTTVNSIAFLSGPEICENILGLNGLYLVFVNEKLENSNI